MRKIRKLDVACPNESCSQHNKVGLRNIVRTGKQPNGTQKYRCKDCLKNFVRTSNTPFFRKHLKKNQIITICKHLAEKNSFRAIARITGHHLDTVRDVANKVAKHCKQFNDYFITELKLSPIEVDEMWSFIKKKKQSVSRRTVAVRK